MTKENDGEDAMFCWGKRLGLLGALFPIGMDLSAFGGPKVEGVPKV